MSGETSRIALTSPTTTDQNEHEPTQVPRRGRGRSAIGTGLAALTLTAALTACGTESNNEGFPDNSPAVTTSASSETTSSVPANDPTKRRYCSDAGELRLPVISKSNVFLTVLSYCVGNPNAPVGFYKPSDFPTQAGEAWGVVENEKLIAPMCQLKGEYIQTDAAAYADVPGKTGTDIWVRGIVVDHQDWGPADVPATNLGYPGDGLAKVYAQQGLVPLPDCRIS